MPRDRNVRKVEFISGEAARREQRLKNSRRQNHLDVHLAAETTDDLTKAESAAPNNTLFF